MTREDVKKIFPDATDEQISSFLNQSNSDVAREKAKAQKLKEDADKAKALEEELARQKEEYENKGEPTMDERLEILKQLESGDITAARQRLCGMP